MKRHLRIWFGPSTMAVDVFNLSGQKLNIPLK